MTKVELKGRSPLAKFLTIKGIVFFTFYQGFLFSILEKHGVIRGSHYWTSTNVSEGLQALCTTFEMVFFSIVMLWSFSVTPYRKLDSSPTQIIPSLLDSQNYGDFVSETCSSIKFFWDYARGQPYTSSRSTEPRGMDFHHAYEFRTSISDRPITHSAEQEPIKMAQIKRPENLSFQSSILDPFRSTSKPKDRGFERV